VIKKGKGLVFSTEGEKEGKNLNIFLVAAQGKRRRKKVDLEKGKKAYVLPSRERRGRKRKSVCIRRMKEEDHKKKKKENNLSFTKGKGARLRRKKKGSSVEKGGMFS